MYGSLGVASRPTAGLTNGHLRTLEEAGSEFGVTWEPRSAFKVDGRMLWGWAESYRLGTVCVVGTPDGHAFISYVREDADRVDQLQHVLEAAEVSVWRDTVKLQPGDDWRKKIRHAISEDSLVFIACFSSHSAARIKSYQNEELTLAIEQLRLRLPDNPWLIPVRFDECDIPDLDLGGGRTLASIQRVDLFGAGRDLGTARLVSAVLRLLGSRPASPDKEPTALAQEHDSSPPAAVDWAIKNVAAPMNAPWIVLADILREKGFLKKKD
jgi:hypothetical protein